MKNLKKSFLSRVVREENGQIIPWMALLTVVILGMAGITLDLGRAYVSYRALQASTDAAALAGAYQMTVSGATTTTVTAQVKAYSSDAGAGANANSNLLNASIGTPTYTCVSGSVFVSVPCGASPTGYNVIQVTQTAQVPTLFIRALQLFKLTPASSLTLTATSTAAIQSGQNQALNLAIIIDTTASMNDEDSDASCNNTQIHCALAGVQTLLQSLSPCTSGSTSSNCLGGYDEVSLFTFPNLQASQASDDTSCPTSNPSIPSYSYVPKPSTTNTTWTAPTGSNPTYQVTTFEDNYSANNQQNGGLATTTALAIAAGANSASNCKGLQAPGGDGTYIASSIYAAITALQAQANARPGSKSALVLLTDGGADSGKFGTGFSTSSSTYPSQVQQCHQTAAAGQYATSLGITVYTVSYGASSNTSDCGSDTNPTMTPCAELLATASSASDFFSDANSTENPGACLSSSNPSLNLQGIFSSIANRFTAARLVPNSVG
jgi:Flp pilus assembly protein TadG